MSNPHLASGSIWRLHHDGQEIARLTVTGSEMFWVHADIETLPCFEPFRELFAEQERAAEAEDWEQADACYEQIRNTLMMTFPDGRPVAEFWLHVHGDGTAGWRWHDEPFGTADDAERKPSSIAADYTWFEQDFPDLADAYCITLVRGLTPAGVLRQLGGDPQQTPADMAAITDAAFDLSQSNSARQFVAMAQVGPWTLMIEPNGYLGVADTIALPASSGTTWVSHFVDVNAVDAFLWAENQECRLYFELMFPEARNGGSPDALLPAMKRIGFPFDTGQSETELSAAAAFALAEEITGVRLTAGLLNSTVFTCGSIPVPTGARLGDRSGGDQ